MVVKIKSRHYKRIPISEVPRVPCKCYELLCVYNTGGCVCDEPQVNKGNSDANCHAWANKRLLEELTVLKVEA